MAHYPMDASSKVHLMMKAIGTAKQLWNRCSFSLPGIKQTRKLAKMRIELGSATTCDSTNFPMWISFGSWDLC
eukprot:m.126112 g.126112  ORF g.126112 m.126112 type:complete len:73 (-) comp13561_c0_seq1:127-345(-)